MIEQIRNFVQLTSRIATAGQPGADQFRYIAESGHRAVINLAMPDHKDSLDHEGALVTGLGMAYIHIPVPFDAPTRDHLEQFIGVMVSLRPSKVFVHCIMNYRVSAFMYHYLRMVEGHADASARSSMFTSWKPNETWQQVMKWQDVQAFPGSRTVEPG